MQIALYQPEIAQNVGSIVRTCSGFGAGLILVHPLGFVWDDKRFRRSKMDYTTATTHINDISGLDAGRLVAVTVSGVHSYRDYVPSTDDIFVFGRESIGLPKDLQVKTSVRIPILTRSLNLATSVAIIVSHFSAYRG